MTNYSGRTTSHSHKFDNWKETPTEIISDCIKNVILFDVQWSNCPIEVEAEVKRLWKNMEFGNDFYYYEWDSVEDEEQYPIIYEYLTSRGVTKCLIHWWW